MARPQKIKLDYFPLVCGFFQDEKIIALRREHGALGIATYIFILTKVYDNGYYLKLHSIEEFATTIAENLSSSREPTAKVATHVVKIIRYMAEIDLLSKQHLKVNCITGVRIQEQYAKSKERYGGSALIKEFSLLSDEHSFPVVSEDKTAVSVTETPVSVTETRVYATEMQQSKINKNKVNNTHSNAREEESDLLDYNALLQIVKEECPVIFNRHQTKVDKGNLQIVREVTQILEQLQGQYSYEQLREIFRKANKIFCVKPSYSSCDIKWVLNNILWVLAEEECGFKSSKQTADVADKPIKGETVIR